MRHLLMKLLKNRLFLFYLVLYVVLLVLLHTLEGFGLVLPIFIFLVMGVGFSALAWWVSRDITPPAFPVRRPAAECILLAVYLLVVVAYLTWGVGLVEESFPTEPAKSLATLAAKLALFVGLPLLLFQTLWKYSLRDFFRAPLRGRSAVRAALWMSAILILFQVVVGQGPNEIRAAGLTVGHLVWGIPFAYAWLIIEVGLVEEFFFRALIQSRLSALLRSEISGVVLMALLFGLAHAPGIYFRTEQTLEGVGASPSWLMALGYSVVVVSVTGFFLGILWARTRNLLLVVLVHAAGDLVPNTAQIMKAWHAG